MQGYVMLLQAYIVRAYKKQCSHPRVRARDITEEGCKDSAMGLERCMDVE